MNDMDTSLWRNRWAGNAIGLLIVVLIIYVARVGVLGPLQRQQIEVLNQTNKLDDFLERSDVIRLEHDKLTRSLNEIRDRMEEVRQRLPDDSQEGEFLQSISEAAGSEGLRIQEYRRGVETEMETHNQLEIRLSGEGTYQPLVGFLDRLAQIERISTIHSLKITRHVDREVCMFEIVMHLYYGFKSKTHTAQI